MHSSYVSCTNENKHDVKLTSKSLSEVIYSVVLGQTQATTCATHITTVIR